MELAKCDILVDFPIFSHIYMGVVNKGHNVAIVGVSLALAVVNLVLLFLADLVISFITE